MSEPESPQKSPYAVDVEAGKTYWWCSCGKSATQPFCDGSHKGGAFAPTEFTAETSETVYFCGCKKNASGVQCDGSHNQL